MVRAHTGTRVAVGLLGLACLGALILPWRGFSSHHGTHYGDSSGGAWSWSVHGPGWGQRLICAVLVLGTATIATRRRRTPAVLLSLLALGLSVPVLLRHREFIIGFVSTETDPSPLHLSSGPGRWCALAVLPLLLAVALRPRPAGPAPAGPDGRP